MGIQYVEFEIKKKKTLKAAVKNSDKTKEKK